MTTGKPFHLEAVVLFTDSVLDRVTSLRSSE